MKKSLRKELESELKKQGDPRMFGYGEDFEKYPYAEDAFRSFYERFASGEKLKPGWVNPTDFERLEGGRPPGP